MPQSHFRVRHDDDVVLNSVTIWCRSHAKVYISVQEVSKSDGKHIHVILDTNKTISTFRQNFLKEFPNLKGNQSYSLALFKEDLDHNIRYACKGTKEQLPNVLYSSITQDDIIDAHKRFWEENKKFLIEKGVDPEKSEKKKRDPPFKEKVVTQLPTGVAAAYSALQAIYNPTDYEKAELQKCKKIIIHTTIRCLGQFGKDCDDGILTKQINGVLIKCVTDYGNKDEAKALFERLEARISYNLY